MKKVKVLVACGSGIATSTLIANSVRNLLSENGYEANITQVKIVEVDKLAKDFDIIVSSAQVPSGLSTPSVLAISYLTGIGKEKTNEEIINILKQLGE